MSITSSGDRKIRQTAKVAYFKRLQGRFAGSELRNIITNFSSDAMSLDSGWIGAAPWPSQRTGRVAHIRLNVTSTRSTPVEWGDTIDVDRKLMADDQTGLINVSNISGLRAERNADHAIYRAVEKLEAGGGTTLGTPYTGVSFFNDAHSDGGQTIDNNLAASGTPGSITAAQMATAVKAAEAAMIAFPDDQGVQFDGDAGNFLHVVHTSMLSPISGALGGNGELGTTGPHASDASGHDGTHRGRAWYHLGLLTSNAKMYSFRMPRDGNVGALVFNQREPWEMHVNTYATSEYCRDNNLGATIHDYARYEIDFGDPRMCALTTFS